MNPLPVDVEVRRQLNRTGSIGDVVFRDHSFTGWRHPASVKRESSTLYKRLGCVVYGSRGEIVDPATGELRRA
jgi:hypothetical protein